MSGEYSVDVCRELEERFRSRRLHRPMRIARYDASTKLVYDVTGVSKADKARVHLVVEKFVGGGFAGQVYRVKVLEIEQGQIEGLEVDAVYAMKILIPPSCFQQLFRNVMYRLGFQGPFQLQVNPAALRAGALWQKFIRRAAKIRFGDENAIVDIYGTFVDANLGSCGEISQWIEGRTWRLEVDDRLDLLKRWRRGETVDRQKLGSPEYRAKREFMRKFVGLLNDTGAYEFARQYEWWTGKSQPNCLKRKDTDRDPSAGLVAVDFRAGLALLPFLPMCPADFGLIARGIRRGSLVQFDRGSLDKLEMFIKDNGIQFSDMHRMLDELKAAEAVYRDSVPDITHNHIRLLYSSQLWATMLDSAATAWKVTNLVDSRCEQKLQHSKAKTLVFYLIGSLPILGRFIRRIWGRADWRRHYREILTNGNYFWRSIQASIAEKVIVWHRAGRVNPQRALNLQRQLWCFLYHLPLSILPAGLHRFLTDWAFFKNKLHYIFVRPIKLYFSVKLREQWLRDMVNEGKKKHILADQDADMILSQLYEPYIQRYLVSLVVHLLTLPLTQIVSVIVAWVYWRKTGDELGAGGILVLFQIIPVSPGSIVRGLYAVAIAIYYRSFKDYNIAVFLSFVKYIGYLAFPIQMTYRYPALARFMAAHWATEAVHIVPVFGERGALLEHWVFCLFYNRPLTIRRRMQKRAQMRTAIKPRYWHTGLCALAATFVFGIADFVYIKNVGQSPALRDIWWLAGLVPLVCGAAVTLGCGGAALWKRVIAAALCGVLLGVLYTTASEILAGDWPITVGEVATVCMWRIFVFALLSAIGAILTELKWPQTNSKYLS